MRHFLKKQHLALLVFSILMPISLATKSSADNANPPKIISVEQTTKGPYKIGDIVSFKINYTGGNPGINFVSVRASSNGACLTQSSNSFVLPQLREVIGLTSIEWKKGQSIESDFSNNKVVSGFVVPCPGGGFGPSVTIVDETGLSQEVGTFSEIDLSNLNFTFIGSDLITPVGEIKPSKIRDSVSIKNIPKSPKVGSKYELPRLSEGGVPIAWRARLNCLIEYKTFIGDLGGTLKFTKPGRCELGPTAMSNDKYLFPKFSANIKMKEFKDPEFVTVWGVFQVRK
jgi:hypothetical protein